MLTMKKVNTAKAQKWDGYFSEFGDPNDKITAIVGINMLDDGLRELLGEPKGKRTRFGTRVNLVYQQGLIDEKLKHDLLLLAEIRNTLAHTLEASSFDYPEIAIKCSQLRFGPSTTPTGSTARVCFMSAVGLIRYALTIKRELSKPSQKTKPRISKVPMQSTLKQAS